jgi:nucleoside-diphosphate-sugar epimerase
MQTILGSNGTIGSLLAKELNNYTQKIRLVSRNPKKVNESDELMALDLSKPENVEQAVAGSDVVYLLVGFEYSLKVWQENWPKLMRATLDACIKHKAKLVFFDNMYSYDLASLANMTEEAALNPPSKKGSVRKACIEMLFKEVKSGKINALIARAADFYGPDNEKSFIIETVYKNLAKGKTPMWFMSADKMHSFTYTPDAAKATAILGNTAEAYNQVWHLPTSSEKLTVRQLSGLFAAETGKTNKLNVFPKWLFYLLGIFSPTMREMPEMMYQYERDYFFNSQKFNKAFGFVPTSYANGVKQIVESAK